MMISKTIKFTVVLVLAQLLLLFSIKAQSSVDQIRIYSKEIKLFADSISFFEDQFEQKKINNVEYQVAMSRLSDQINYFSAYIYNEALPILDSIYLANKEAVFVDSSVQNQTINEIISELPEDNIKKEDPAFEFDNKKKFNPVMTATKILSGSDSKRSSWNIILGIGSSFLKGGNSNIGLNPSTNLWHSVRIPQDIGLMIRTRIGSTNSKIGLSYGFLFNYFSMTQTTNLARLSLNEAGKNPMFLDVTGMGIDKIKISGSYLKIPFGLDVRINKLWLNVNSYIKLLMLSKQVFNFDNSVVNKSQLIYRNHIGVHPISFGIEYLVGYKKYGFVLQQDFTNLLGKDARDCFTAWQFGLRLRI